MTVQCQNRAWFKFALVDPGRNAVFIIAKGLEYRVVINLRFSLDRAEIAIVKAKRYCGVACSRMLPHEPSQRDFGLRLT